MSNEQIKKKGHYNFFRFSYSSEQIGDGLNLDRGGKNLNTALGLTLLRNTINTDKCYVQFSCSYITELFVVNVHKNNKE